MTDKKRYVRAWLVTLGLCSSQAYQAKPRGTKRLGDENTLFLINSYQKIGPGQNGACRNSGRDIKASFAPIAAGSRNLLILRGTSGGWKRSGLACADVETGVVLTTAYCKTYIKPCSCRVRDPRVLKLNRFCNAQYSDRERTWPMWLMR